MLLWKMEKLFIVSNYSITNREFLFDTNSIGIFLVEFFYENNYDFW